LHPIPNGSSIGNKYVVQGRHFASAADYCGQLGWRFGVDTARSQHREQVTAHMALSLMSHACVCYSLGRNCSKHPPLRDKSKSGSGDHMSRHGLLDMAVTCMHSHAAHCMMAQVCCGCSRPLSLCSCACRCMHRESKQCMSISAEFRAHAACGREPRQCPTVARGSNQTCSGRALGFGRDTSQPVHDTAPLAGGVVRAGHACQC
jgi:hypothetical protein